MVKWFAIEAYKWVTKNVISDGTRPNDYATREEVWTMLHRLYYHVLWLFGRAVLVLLLLSYVLLTFLPLK